LPNSLRSATSLGVRSSDNLIKLMLTYPKSVGRNFDEILRVLDALQLNESGPFATPADWRPCDRAIVTLDIPTDAAQWELLIAQQGAMVVRGFSPEQSVGLGW
jgi:thioredoxin-dependent peroxiredoxin